jgi:hypothetical protein
LADDDIKNGGAVVATAATATSTPTAPTPTSRLDATIAFITFVATARTVLQNRPAVRREEEERPNNSKNNSPMKSMKTTTSATSPGGSGGGLGFPVWSVRFFLCTNHNQLMLPPSVFAQVCISLSFLSAHTRLCPRNTPPAAACGPHGDCLPLGHGHQSIARPPQNTVVVIVGANGRGE